MIIHRCTGCGYEAIGMTELEAEIKFGRHRCWAMDKVENMSTEELHAIVMDQCMKTKGVEYGKARKKESTG